MCSFFFSTDNNISDINKVNHFLKRRGPDYTSVKVIDNMLFLHNLLSITGNFTIQPYTHHDDNYVCIFNGEIYNYKGRSESEFIIEAYKDYGKKFVNYLDGEFSILIYDKLNQTIIVASDIFKTKPLYYSKNNDNFYVSTYASALNNINKSLIINKFKPNHILEYSIQKKEILSYEVYHDFSLKQYKKTYDDWCLSFEKAVLKRSDNNRENIFIGLSCGHDSGAISLALNNHNKKYSSYTIRADEDLNIINHRHILNSKNNNKCHLINLSRKNFNENYNFLIQNCENEKYEHNSQASVLDDKASMGLAEICKYANKNNEKIYLSGQGADEIISCYMMFGRPIYSHSSFNGIFPEDLSKVFPWKSFYGGTMASYLSKEECVNGAYGIESRYPFLDKDVVQEFLNLSHNLKNKEYKAPLDYYLTKQNYPFLKRVKKGFSADRNLI